MSFSLTYLLSNRESNICEMANKPTDDCLKKLHWLPIHNRIIFKIALMTYRTLATSNPPYIQHLLFRRHTSGLRSSSTIQLHQPVQKSSIINILVCLSCCLECLTSPSKRSTIPGALQTSPEDSPLQDTNTKLMKTQGASDAMQMAHYKLTIIVIIIIIILFLFFIYYFFPLFSQPNKHNYGSRTSPNI